MARELEDDDEDFNDEEEGTDADADGQDQFGRLKYIAKCKELAVNPVSQILKYLESDELHVVHYGLGLKATLALCHAMKFNQTLTVVRVTDNSIPDEGLAQLVEVVSERNVIVNLDISGNRVGPLTVAALIPFLTTKHCSLKNLSLARTRLADKEAYQLALPMEVNTSLRVMDLSNNDLAERSALAFATMLQTNLTLMDLDLSWNKLRAKGAAALAEGLKPNMSLQVLGIAWCGVQDVGAVAFGATFKTNHGMVDVDMSGNGITAAGAEALAGGLATSASLAALNLDNNDVRDKGVAALLAAVTTNAGIVACGIENTNCSNGLRAELEAMLAPRKLAQKQRQAQRVSTGG